MKQLKQIVWIVLWLPLVAFGALSSQPVSVVTTGEPLFVVARTIEKSIGKKVVLQDVAQDQLIKGNYSGADGKAFMDNFANANGFAWIESADRVILAPAGTDLRSPIKPTEKKAVTTSFTRVLHDPKDRNKLGLMIFQVHNAWANDRQLGAVPVVGVATLFAQYVGIPMTKPAGTAGALPPPVESNRVQRVPPSNSQQNQVNILGLFKQNIPIQQPQREEAVEGGAPVSIATRGVYADGRLNAILVRDKVEFFETYKQIITLLDRPTDMVQLDAMIVDLQKDRALQYGIDWTSGTTLAGGTGSIILGASAGAKLLAKIRAAQSNHESSTVSVPSVVTLNNVEATFSSMQDVYIPVEGSYDASLNKATAETALRVTPLIANDSPDIPYNERRVKLLVNIKDGSVTAPTLNEKTGKATQNASTSQNQLTTQAVVRSGDMLVIGGQIVRKKMNSSSGIPVLSSLPVVGGLFGVKGEQYDEYLRIYIVRTRILGEDSQSASEVVSPLGENVTELIK